MKRSLKISIWGKEFILPVEYDCYEGEKITETQKGSVNALLSHPEWIDKSKKSIVAYCKDRVMRDNKKDIFSYLDPKYLFVKRDEQDPSIALMLDFSSDPEHGVAIVYKLNGDIKIGSQDIIL
jgi:hypothetical protein